MGGTLPAGRKMKERLTLPVNYRTPGCKTNASGNAILLASEQPLPQFIFIATGFQTSIVELIVRYGTALSFSAAEI
jgi:hypothetical protein